MEIFSRFTFKRHAIQSIEDEVDWTTAAAADEAMDWFTPPHATLFKVEPPIATEVVTVGCSLLPVDVVLLKFCCQWILFY